jgi:hypothetical protein
MADGVAKWTELHPVDGVALQDGRWDYPALGISILAPPLFLTPDSSPEDFGCAREALDSGLATARHVGSRGLLNKLLHPGPLPATESAALTAGSAHSQAQSLAMMLRSLGWPLALSAAAWWVMEAAGLRILALLGSLFFLILVSLVLHELGHIAVFRIFAPSAPALFSVRSGRFRLVRCGLPKHQDLAVTIAGPAAPFLLPVLLFPFYVWLPILFWTSVVVAGSHLALLLRNDGDGRMLRVALRQGPAD